MRLLFAPIWHAFGLLLVVPVPHGHFLDHRVRARSVAWFPLVGSVLGLIAFGISYVFQYFAPQLSERLVAGIVLSITIGLTGALHWDGLADTLDGWGARLGGPEKMLAAMRDPRLGTMAVLAICCLLLLQWEAIATLLSAGQPQWLVAAMTVSRFAVTTLCVVGKPLASESSNGHAAAYIEGSGWKQLLAGFALTAGVLFIVLTPLECLWTFGITAVSVVWVYWQSRKWLGGVTGDVLGFVAVVTETACLLAACASIP